MSDPYCVTGFALELYITAPSDGLCFPPTHASSQLRTDVKVVFFSLSPSIDIIAQNLVFSLWRHYFISLNKQNKNAVNNTIP